MGIESVRWNERFLWMNERITAFRAAVRQNPFLDFLKNYRRYREKTPVIHELYTLTGVEKIVVLYSVRGGGKFVSSGFCSTGSCRVRDINRYFLARRTF